MTCVAADSPVLHVEERFLADNVGAAGHGHEEIADLRRLAHGHYLEAVHYGFHSLYRVYLGDDNVSAETLRAHCNALSAPAVACDHNVLSGYDKVGRAVDAVPYGLSGAVAVIEQVFAVGVVYQHHREFQRVILIHGLQADNSGGGLLAAAQHLRDKLGVLVVNEVYQVAAVVDYYVGASLDDLRNVAVVLLV